MAGEDAQTLGNGDNGEVLTIIPTNGKVVNGNGVHPDINGKPKNGIANGAKPIDDSPVDLGKLTPSLDQNSKTNLAPDYDSEGNVLCGWGSIKPKWMQMFASKQLFLVFFCISWVLQGMYFTYFVSVITTIEKLFQIQSKTTGMIMSATEIGQISSSLLLTYYGGQGHRPRWIASGMVVFAMSALTCSLPHFIYGDQLIRQNELLFNGLAAAGELNITNSTDPMPANLCKFIDNPDNFSLDGLSTATTLHRLQKDSDEYCQGQFVKEQNVQNKITTVVLAIFFVSLLGVGMGQTAVFTLGVPFIDDNVANRESPLYFSITIGIRILGPALGFMLGSFCTMIYADLSAPPITPSDPRWVGAWWLGLVIISAMLLSVSLAMFAFPQKLPIREEENHKKPKDLEKSLFHFKPPPAPPANERPSIKNFPKALKRLLKNDILLFRTASSVLHILPIAGLYTFLPKYLESQFRLPAHHANLISGVGGILMMGPGIILSGVVILKKKPSGKSVAGWIAFTTLIYAIGMGILMFIGCPTNDFAGIVTNEAGVSSFQPTCETSCDCDPNKFSPICGADGKTHFSACHAGCTNYTITDGKVSSYGDCQCIGQNAETPKIVHTADVGYCPLDCNGFWPYIILFSVFVFIHATNEVGCMMLVLRCVDPRDKAMALGLTQFAVGLFGNMPCPIVYGTVVDTACLVWEYSCGERGSCWLYDSNVFRMFFHGTTATLLGLAFLMDLAVWYKASNIVLIEDKPKKPENGTVDELTSLKDVDVINDS